MAPVAMVFGSAHWIVVRGYDASDAPASVDDVSYSLTAFDVNNPWPPTPSPAPPPPHTAGDPCGGGGNRGVANEHITYATWQADYMTGIPGGYWAGKFVAACDPEPPGQRLGTTRRPTDRTLGDRLIGTQAAARSAQSGLRAYGLYERKGWQTALRDTGPGEPVLVQRLDHLDRYYYIVPMQTSPERVPVLASVDARFGDYRQAVALPEGSQLVAGLDQRELVKRVVGNKFELEDRLGRLLVRGEAYCLYPIPVWKPCRESLSPFWPFYMFSVGAHRLYIRIDGAVFTKLHDDERGI